MGSSKPVAIILDAYRRSNAGDGLLVDETVSLVREALPGVEITVVSMDPQGFEEYGRGLHPLSGADGSSPSLLQLLRSLVTGRPHPDVTRAIEAADVAVAVGGGYLRANALIPALKSYLSHVVQAPTRSSTTQRVYLPQSIGPLPPRPLPFGLGRLRRASSIFVRDDRSLKELAARGVTAQRLPDLAVLALARSGVDPRPLPSDARIGLVARSLHGDTAHYVSGLERLRDDLDAEVLVQSRGAGNNDPEFYESIGWQGEFRDLLPALSSEQPPAAVVSVRLHGSLQSLLAGVPSVHLSYERKGWGAYEDLGIADYVHHAWNFDPELVARQAHELRDDPTPYWDRIAEALGSHADARRQLISAIQAAGR